jgi:putative nucleotidyltransferase with HDIG domain
MIPTKQQCMELFEKYVLLSNVRQHCIAVATVATYLGRKIKQKQPDLNLDLVFATAIFHDMGKAAVISDLFPEKYNFRPLNEEELNVWKELREMAAKIQESLPEGKKVHETDVVVHLVEPLYPDFVQYIRQIGGTKDKVYFESGTELKITHYADWILHVFNLVSFDKRLDFLFDKYWNDLTQEQREDRKKREFALEKELFEGLDITTELNLEELNQLKEELFGEAANFTIGRVDQID